MSKLVTGGFIVFEKLAHSDSHQKMTMFLTDLQLFSRAHFIPAMVANVNVIGLSCNDLLVCVQKVTSHSSGILELDQAMGLCSLAVEERTTSCTNLLAVK